MEISLPREIQVIDLWPASIRYILPKRDLGKGRWFGWALVLLGIAGMTAAVLLALAFADVVPWFLGRFLKSPAIILALVTVGGTIPLWFGMAGLFGHREIEIRGEYLRTIERIGPLWCSRRWKIKNIYVMHCCQLSLADTQGNTVASLQELLSLRVRLTSGKEENLAWGYGVALLEPLGRALTDRCNVALERIGLPRSVQPFAALANIEDDADFDEEDGDGVEAGWSEAGEGDSDPQPILAPPPDSRIAVDRFEGGLTMTVPPAGLWKGSSGLFFFAILWNGAIGVFTTIAVLAIVQGDGGDFDGKPWLLPLILSPFWIVGIAVLLGAINMGRRRAMIALAAGKVLVMQTGIFGVRQREWPVDDVASIVAGPSGMKVNDRPVIELQIHPDEGSKFGMLAGRSDLELEWLAHELHAALRAAQKKTPPAAYPPASAE
jgi:hypothetical protein